MSAYTIGSVYKNAEMAAAGFCIAQNLAVQLDGKPALVGKYAAWFREHAEWFIDPLDIKMMRFILTQLQHYPADSVRHVVITKQYDAMDEQEIQNWYTKYTMFDPTMGMYDPTEARAYFEQRMLKRLNMVAYMLEKPPRSRRR